MNKESFKLQIRIYFFKVMKKQLNTNQERDKEFNDAADLVGSATGFMVFCHQFCIMLTYKK
jgi:hypothetical protein